MITEKQKEFYWCNNTKTDTFTEEEFKKVGKVFREIWEERLGRKNNTTK